MIIQMILREVREGCACEAQARHAVLMQRMRGDLHHDGMATGTRHGRQLRLKLAGIRCRPDSRDHTALIRYLNRGDQADLLPIFAQHLMQEPGCRCLSVRPGDSEHLHLATGPAVDGAGQNRLGLTCILHQDCCLAAIPQGHLRNNRHSAACQSRRSIFRSIIVSARDRNKNIAGTYTA